VTRAENATGAFTGDGAIGDHLAAADEDMGDPPGGGAEPLTPSW
jgi:hypothetical protein